MAIFDPVARAATTHAANTGRVKGLLADKLELERAKPDPSDFDGLIKFQDEIAAINRNIAVAEGVANHSAGLLARVRAEAEVKAKDAEHAAEERQAAADAKLAREVADLVAKLAEKRDRLAASNARTADYNLNRGGRPYVMTAEERARRRPAHTVPAVRGTITVWRNAAGEEPRQWTRNAAGEMIPAGHEMFTKRSEVAELQPAREVPAQMFEAYATALVLVSEDGRKL